MVTKGKHLFMIIRGRYISEKRKGVHRINLSSIYIQNKWIFKSMAKPNRGLTGNRTRSFDTRKKPWRKKFCWFFPPQISWIFSPLLEIDNWNKCINRRQLSAAVTLGLDQSLWPLYQPFYRGFTWSGYSLHAPDFRWNLRSSEDPYSFTNDLTHYELSNVSIITGQWLSQGYGDWYSVSIYPTPQQPGPVKLSQQLISRHQYNSFVFQSDLSPH